MSIDGRTVVTLNPRRVRLAGLVSTIFILFLGLGMAALFIFAAVSGRGADMPVIGWVMGTFWSLVFLGIGVPATVQLPRSMGTRTFELDVQSITFRGRRSWSLQWSELNSVVIVHPPAPGSYRLSRIRPAKFWSFLLVYPRDTIGFADRHGRTRWRRRDGGYLAPLTITDGQVVAELDGALRRYGGPAYGGVRSR